jgi:2-dehydro-3-deoxygluconokinase
MAHSIVTFGEVMGRISPKGFLRLSQALPGEVDWTFGGGEANVALSLAWLGLDAAFVTALPRNPIADACLRFMRGHGVDVSRVVRTDEGRVGLYFLEAGANQRPSVVTYDRAGSSIMLAPPEAYNWPLILQGKTWFHVTGITPGLSHNAAEAVTAAARAADAAGLTVSVDLNFRKKLWNWHPGIASRDLAERTMRGILPYADLVIANEEDAEMVLGIKAENTDVERGHIEPEAYVGVARRIVKQFPDVSLVAITLRQSVSASHNDWGGMLYVNGTDGMDGAAYFAPLDAEGHYAPYSIRNIVDRVGGGDSFVAGLICALCSHDYAEPAAAVAFAAAASCLKHSIPGDVNFVTRSEVEALMKGQASGRVRR